MISYLDRINYFWSVNEAHPSQATGIALYFYLLKVANARYWKGPYRISSNQICGALRIDKKTLQRARNALKQAGLLDFTNGKTDHSPTEYRFLTPAEREAFLTDGGTTRGIIPLVTPPETPPVLGIIGEEDKESTVAPVTSALVPASVQPPTLDQIKCFASGLAGIPADVAEAYWNDRMKTDPPFTYSNGQRVGSWHHDIASYWRNWQSNSCKSQKPKTNGTHLKTLGLAGRANRNAGTANAGHTSDYSRVGK